MKKHTKTKASINKNPRTKSAFHASTRGNRVATAIEAIAANLTAITANLTAIDQLTNSMAIVDFAAHTVIKNTNVERNKTANETIEHGE